MDERPCWVWWAGAWHEGFVLEWQQDWQNGWEARAEWSVEDEHGAGLPGQHRAVVPAALVVERFSTDPRGRGGKRPTEPPESLSD